MTVSSDGSFTFDTIENDGTTGSQVGTLNITNDGIITVPGNPTFSGGMDAGKTIIAHTDTWVDGTGTTEISVWLKR